METPQDLTELEYARHMLESIGWPCRGNLELIADCLTSVARAKKLTLPQALTYLERAVKLAKEQGVKVDRFFFQGGDYMNIRPQNSRILPTYKPVDRAATEAEQNTPEFLESSRKAREALKRMVQTLDQTKVM